MQTKLLTALTSFFLITNVAAAPNYKCSSLFLLLGTGASFSNRASISADSPWDPANQGYNANLGQTAFYTAGIGYQFNPLISVDIEATIRPSYSYSKFQTTSPQAASPGDLGIKTRKFDLANTNAMANIIVNGQGLNLFAKLGPCTILQPFVGLGAGVAYNTVSNFRSILATGPAAAPTSRDVSSLMDPYTNATFAWQAFAGVEVIHAQTWGVDLAYRYYDGGIFKSNNYLTNVLTGGGFTLPITVPRWNGRLTANEAYLNLKYFF